MRKIGNYLLMVLAIAGMTACDNSTGKDDSGEQTDIPVVPLEDFFRNPEKSGYQISPDGTYLSYLAPYESRLNIFVKKLDADSATRITGETDRDIAGYFWANDNRILFLKDNAGDENYKLFGVNLDGSNLIGLTDFEGVKTDIIDPLEDIPSEMIVGLNKRNPMIFDPYRLNIETGELTMLAENPGNIMGWMTDHDGKLRVAISVDGLMTSILYRETEKEEFKPVLTTNYKESLEPLFFTFDNKNVYASSNLGRDKKEIVLFDIAAGKEVESIFKNDEVDVTGLSFSRKRKVLTAASYTTDKYHRHFFDNEAKSLFDRLEKDLGTYEIYITGMSDEEDKFIVRTYSDRSMGSYYLYDKKSDELALINEVSPWIDEKVMAEMKPVEYKSQDGLVIHGYLSLPVGKDPKNLPVVINPHGGPWYRDSWGFNPEVQFLVNRGYAVLQMNFRGSTGYGRAFEEASYKEWGGKMQDDITDGVNWLVEQGIADKNKIAIYGGSYGGYATLCGLTFTPDLYACGVDYVGVSNIFTFYKSFPEYWKPVLEMMYDRVGDPVADSLMLYNVSPVFHVDKIKAPLFIAQGANDPRVNKAESDQMVEAMKARGVEVEYMVKDNEGHGFHNEENRFDFYRAMEKFLDKHLKAII